MQAKKTNPDVDPDVLAAAEMPVVDDEIDDSLYDSGLPGPLGHIDKVIARIEAIFLAVGVLLMALNTVANVVGRYVFGQSLYFSEEVNQALIVLITFSGISYAARHGRHIRMSAFFDALPDKGRKVAMALISLLTGLLLMLLAWYALNYVITQAGRGRVLPALQIPQWWIIIWAPMGFFLTGLQYLMTALKNVTDPGIWLSTSTRDGYSDDSDEKAQDQ
ncbi:TRAP transporter small permease [Paracoccus sp. JM45]|uniref:TRAP transporter small permease n=1 Tax=Paracoccus sp. JM45 TaxID=2283626 RepID=UPI0026CEE445